MINDYNTPKRLGGETNMTEKQQDIMNAAIEIFAQKGFAATTTSEIAKRAGVGEGTIFHYYKTKLDLLLAVPDYLSRSAVTRNYMEELISLFDHPPERFEDFIGAIVRNRQKFMTHNIPLIKALFQEIPLHPALKARLADSVLFPAMNRMITAIEGYMKKGVIADMPAMTTAKLLMTTILGYFYAAFVAGVIFPNDNPERDAEYLITYIVGGLGACNGNRRAEEAGK